MRDINSLPSRQLPGLICTIAIIKTSDEADANEATVRLIRLLYCCIANICWDRRTSG